MERSTRIFLVLLIVAVAAVVAVFIVILYLVSSTFNSFGAPNIGPTCISSFKYICQAASLNNSGMLSAGIGQNTGMTEYNFAVACTASVNSTNGGPYSIASPWVYAGTDGVLSTHYNANNTLVMQSGMRQQFSGIQCYGQNGLAFSGPLGAEFNGFIWIEFTSNAGQPSTSNPYIIVKAAALGAEKIT